MLVLKFFEKYPLFCGTKFSEQASNFGSFSVNRPIQIHLQWKNLKGWLWSFAQHISSTIFLIFSSLLKTCATLSGIFSSLNTEICAPFSTVLVSSINAIVFWSSLVSFSNFSTSFNDAVSSWCKSVSFLFAQINIVSYGELLIAMWYFLFLLFDLTRPTLLARCLIFKQKISISFVEVATAVLFHNGRGTWNFVQWSRWIWTGSYRLHID